MKEDTFIFARPIVCLWHNTLSYNTTICRRERYFSISYLSVDVLFQFFKFYLLLEIDALDIFDGGKRATEGPTATAGIWSTYPFSDGNKSISNASGFADQVNHPII